jgi:uncharacterized cupin superfamily protein
MASESPLEQTEHGLAATGNGWFVVNAKDATWRTRPGRGGYAELEGLDGKVDFPQLGINIQVLGPGEPMAMYHYEHDQEGFLVLAGEPLLIVEGQERALRPWDFVHCPAGTKHVIVGAGETDSVVVAIGARERSTGPDWGAYTVDEAAIRHGAGVERETSDPEEAYARFPPGEPSRYRSGWLPE